MMRIKRTRFYNYWCKFWGDRDVHLWLHDLYKTPLWINDRGIWISRAEAHCLRSQRINALTQYTPHLQAIPSVSPNSKPTSRMISYHVTLPNRYCPLHYPYPCPALFIEIISRGASEVGETLALALTWFVAARTTTDGVGVGAWWGECGYVVEKVGVCKGMEGMEVVEIEEVLVMRE